MKIRETTFFWLGILVSLLPCGAFALEYYPIQAVFVQPGVPTPVVLAVGTPEELATLVFIIVEPPKFGVLLGFPPELVYIPRKGYIGLDWFSFLIQTKDGRLLDYGRVQLWVTAAVALISPSLRSKGTLTLSGPPFTLERYRFEFGLDALFQYLKTRTDAIWDQTGFSSFRTSAQVELRGGWPIPWPFLISSTLTFSPPPTLSSWTVSARTTILGWDFSGSFFFSGVDPQTRSYTTFTIRGAVDRYSLRSHIKFATLTPTFAEAVLDLRGPWLLCADCPLRWELEFVQKKTGFHSLQFTIKDLPIPCPQCKPLRIYMDTEIKFTAREKTVKPGLRLLPAALCVRPLVELLPLPDGFGISGLNLYGVELRCDLPAGYRARFATSFDPAKDSLVTGYGRFFQVMLLEGPVVPCCGPPGWWQIAIYFERRVGILFGLGMVDMNVYFPISREVTLNVRVQAGHVDPTVPTKKWIFTFGWQGLF